LYSLGLVALTSFAFALLFTLLVRNCFLRFGWMDVPDGKRKNHVRPIPRAGGIAIAMAYAGSIGILACARLSGWVILRFDPTVLWSVLPATLLVFITGLLDDRRSLSPKLKFTSHAIAALFAFAGGLHVRTLHHHGGLLRDWWWSLPVTVFWLVLCTNAFNLIDGMDGLSSGLGLFATLTLICAALLQHNFPLLLAIVPLAGALLGFLYFNFNPASIFLGDCGSYMIGFLLGCFGLIWSQKSATLLGLAVPMMAFSVPLLDVGLTVVRRFLRGQPIFTADRLHLHHRLLDRGLTPRRAALVLYGAGALAAGLSLLSALSHGQYAGLILVLLCGAAWLCIQSLGYTEIDTAGRMIFHLAGQVVFHQAFRRVLKSQLILRAARHSLSTAETPALCWEVLRATARDLGFCSAMLTLNGVVFFESFQEGEPHSVWTMNIPLEGAGRMQLAIRLDQKMPHDALGPFIEAFRGKVLRFQCLSNQPQASKWLAEAHRAG